MNQQFDEQDLKWSQYWLAENLKLGSAQWGALNDLLRLLAAENEQQNLVAKGTLPFAWSRHIVDSLQLITHVPRGTSTWLDLGTGAGFPGLACAIALPQTHFTLVEQRPRRTEWLERAKVALGLRNVEIVTANISQVPKQDFDVISARAFAPLEKLLNLSAAFSTKATAWVLPKGRSATHELETLKGWRHMFHVEQSVTDPQSGIITGHLIGRK
ncbi:16S rRNA (guanine(527)-N(7))-methyltransferase RsmG [Croceicoccus naphthovorans]|uniref:Ribosomal RNA small subunit methyltransferase G n=1 Tax=Croceicoccus naphthovorans TaxID=1348774 RepID=A0A0G3XKT1_9SPHN|nr:16S rRNA (guanine(527)-N(7))-methyltransferase RsmG [Croceicoccus naphthovorans]AKM11194.1 hypothetical protein AB433_16395 [Croceicoccus naphthovorans]MBB3989913.1 16S rRNA (guanine527-N7)-methyltransferase [Croceicoccus naphthovorans]